MADLNRINIILNEQHKTVDWLAKELHTSVILVGEWCANETQPTLVSLFRIAGVLNVEVSSLINESAVEDVKKMYKYVLEMVDPNNPHPNALYMFMNDITTDEEAIVEAEAQLGLMSEDGGIPHDEMWSAIDCRLMADKKCIWTDGIDFDWSKERF